jgi:hypothetical protein
LEEWADKLESGEYVYSDDHYGIVPKDDADEYEDKVG